jgi:peptidoglycan/xylan/chitin deacetylase (PgdA/CDA1 family)
LTPVIVLCYHALSPTWEADLSTTPARFERQIALLVARGYRGVTFSAAVESAARSERDRVVAVTFDDAYRSVLELARPVLDRYGFPATVFVPTDYVDASEPPRWPGIDHWYGGPHERELLPMSWPELRSLADLGWEIGSHSGSHPHLTSLDDARLEDELVRSKASCEHHLEGSCISFAYPYGDVNRRVVAAVARAGYGTAAALPQRLHAPEPLAWPRIGIYRADGALRFRLKISPALIALRRSRAWDWLGSVRGTLRG